MKVTSFDRLNISNIRQEMTKAFKPLEEKYGLKFNIGTIRFSEVDLRTTVEAVIASAQEAQAKTQGYPAIGTEFKVKGMVFKVIEIRPSRRKYPITAENRMGTRYKFTPLAVAAGKL